MNANHDKKRPRRVAEPVQVYLDARQRSRLERLVEQLEISKSDVLRMGLEALERQLLDPKQHPALRLVGIAVQEPGPRQTDRTAREHDLHLTEGESKSWRTRAGSRKRGR